MNPLETQFDALRTPARQAIGDLRSVHGVRDEDLLRHGLQLRR